MVGRPDPGRRPGGGRGSLPTSADGASAGRRVAAGAGRRPALRGGRRPGRRGRRPALRGGGRPLRTSGRADTRPEGRRGGAALRPGRTLAWSRPLTWCRPRTTAPPRPGRRRTRRAAPRCAAAGCTWPPGRERAGRTGLDLAAVGGHGQVGDGGVLGLARAVRHDARVGGPGGQVHGVERLGQRADLVDLDQDRRWPRRVDAPAQPLLVGDEEVVADELHRDRRARRSAPPSRPSRPRPCRPRSRRSGSGRTRSDAVVDHLVRGRACAPRRPARRRRPGRTRSRPGPWRWRSRRPGTRPAASMASTRMRHGVLVRGRFGAKPPSSPTAVDRPRVVQHAGQRVVGLDAPAQRLGERGRAHRHDHELLQVDGVVGVHAAVDDVHHRHRQHVGVGAADVAVERQLELVGGGLGHGQRHAEDGVGAEPALVVGVPSRSIRAQVEAALVEGVEARRGRRRSRR